MSNEPTTLPNLEDLIPEEEPVPAVICRVCFAHFEGWGEYLDHIEAEHPDDKHRMQWAMNAKADLVRQRAKEAADKAKAEAAALAKKQRLEDMRARIKARAEQRQAEVAARKEKLKNRRNGHQEDSTDKPNGHKSGGHSWLYWLFTERSKQTTVVALSPEDMMDRLRARDERQNVTSEPVEATADPSQTQPNVANSPPAAEVAVKKPKKVKKPAKPTVPEPSKGGDT